MNPFDPNQIRTAFRAGRCSEGEAIRLLQFHHNMDRMTAMRFLGILL